MTPHPETTAEPARAPVGRAPSLNLRLALAPRHLRPFFAALLLWRAEAADAAAFHAPEAIAAEVFGCAPAEAGERLAELRAAGLVGEGLAPLVGVRGAPRARAAGAPANDNASAEGDDLRARAKASGHSVSELARLAGLERSALSKYLGGGAGLGPERRAKLAAALGCGAGVQPNHCETPGVQSPVQLHTHDAQHSTVAQHTLDTAGSPPDLPRTPSENSEQTPLSGETNNKNNNTAGAREVVAQGVADPAATLTLATPARAGGKGKAKAPAPKVDPVPEPGTLARRIYDAIVGDPCLCPITVGPGDYAQRIANPDAYRGVDVLAEVLAAGEHLSRKPAGHRSDGRAFLRRWLLEAAKRAASTPRPAPAPTGAAPRAFAPSGKVPPPMLASEAEREAEARAISTADLLETGT